MPDLGGGVLDRIDDPVLGVAVSGGSDSTALLCLADDWARAVNRHLLVVTVDHGLRPDSAAEAAAVAELAARLGWPHSILRWEGWDGRGNLQDAARNARTRLIARWAGVHGVATVLTGHTRDDQAETVLMRLARGSGVDGLSGIAPVSRREGLVWVRPLLDVTRAALRAMLEARGIAWIEDPSNDDPRFERVRLREAGSMLESLGLTTDRLAETARAMSRARDALEAETERLARAVARPAAIGTVTLAKAPLFAAAGEIRLRLLAHSLQWVSAARYRPRLSSLTALEADVRDRPAGQRSLLGCLISWTPESIVICREAAHVGGPVAAGEVWDGRWITAGPPGLTVEKLGEAGLRALPDWRAAGQPRAALLSSPAFWQNDAVFAVPFAMPVKGCHAELKDGPEGFFAIADHR